MASFGPIIPGRFMYRSLSRGLDEITAVRVERLQSISNDDCAAEGILTKIGKGMIDGERVFLFSGNSGYSRIGAHAYQELWDSINGTGSLANNPFVWVITFKVIQ